MKTLDLRSGSRLVKEANEISFGGEYSKHDWEVDQGGDKFHSLIANLREDLRLACIFVMNGEEDVIQALADSDFKNDLVLNFGDTK